MPLGKACICAVSDSETRLSGTGNVVSNTSSTYANIIEDSKCKSLHFPQAADTDVLFKKDPSLQTKLHFSIL